MSQSSVTTKPINLAQLVSEMGAANGLNLSVSGPNGPFGSNNKIVTDGTDTFTTTQLDTAITNHTAVNTDANRATLVSRAQSALTANANFLAIATPTNAQVLAQVQLLSKECNGLIRLLLNALDSTANT